MKRDDLSIRETTLAMVAAASPDAARNWTAPSMTDRPQHDVQILKQVTDLFLSNVERLRESQISAFDELLVPLIDRTEAGDPGPAQRGPVHTSISRRARPSEARIPQRRPGGRAGLAELQLGCRKAT